MTPPKYPLCESLGVQPFYMATGDVTQSKWVVDLEALEKALAAAPVVTGVETVGIETGKLMGQRFWDTNGDVMSCEGVIRHTHTARLVAITPMVRDSAESLLRELLATDSGGKWLNRHEYTAFLERARKLLDGAK